MSWSGALFAGGVAAAGLLSAADAALVTEGGAPTGDDPPSTGAERERAHRSLALARVMSLLLAGAGAWSWISAAGVAGGRALAVLGLVALAAVIVIEGVARSVGDALGARALRSLRPIVALLRLPVEPLAWMGTRLDRWLERVLPPATDEEAERAATAEQFREVVSSDADVTRAERVLLDGVFTLADTDVREVMVPRVEVDAVERETPWSELVDRLRSSGHARMPVFDGGIDDVVGILHAKDLLAAIVADEEPAGGWASLVRPAAFIPATKTLDLQLRDFKASGAHIAVVVDEYGGMAGLVTIEDILEEIVGEIRDEHDEEEAELDREGNDRFWASGKLPIDELSEATGCDFGHDGITTVGGLVYARLGRVPKAGEILTVDDFKIVVERVVRRRVLRVYFERLSARRVSGQTRARVSGAAQARTSGPVAARRSGPTGVPPEDAV